MSWARTDIQRDFAKPLTFTDYSRDKQTTIVDCFQPWIKLPLNECCYEQSMSPLINTRPLLVLW